ncbi:MAG: GIY-YIG nuclease family protein [Candidatus Wildermuthbacteria bacterium]|nr:GIY-YIG nuclease family protein [Candidatus Wildermuthbacteria bacterium]
MFFYVYILQSKKDHKFYIGYTNDLRRRFQEHNKGLSFATKGRTPFILIYYEAYLNRQDAEGREKFFKTGWGKQYMKRVLKNYFNAKI